MFKNLKKIGFEIIKFVSLVVAIILIVYGIMHYILGI